MKLALITPSFSLDYALCVELCRSIDALERDGLEHIIIVPRDDLAKFAPLQTPRRRVIAEEEFLPPLTRLPLPTVVSIPGVFRKRLRKLYLSRRGAIVRGWIVQQVLKLTVNRICDADGYVFVDSDVVFVRPFGHDTFVRDGRMIFYREPDALDPSLEEYKRWQDVGCDLAGLPHEPFNGENFITAIVPWRRDVLEALQQRIEAVSGRDIADAVIGLRHLSEYVVYGVFATRTPGLLDGTPLIERPLAHESWAYDVTTEDGRAAFTRGLGRDAIAILMQSTDEWDVETRREAVATITAGLDGA